MIIHRLEVEGFGIIAKRLSLTFPEQGKIGIFGVNESGKSTLFRAIEFALFGLRGSSAPSSSRENLVTWGKQHARVMLEFLSGGKRYRIERIIAVRSGHDVRLWHVVEGQAKLLENNVREVERTIEEITGLDRDAFTKLIYIKQKELDTLKELTRARREELVNKLMGMEVFDQADNKVKEALRHLEILLGSLSNERDRLAEEHQRFQELHRRRGELSDKLAQFEEKRISKDRRFQQLTAELHKLDWLRRYNDLSTLYNEKNRAVESLEKQLNQRERLRKELAAIQEEIVGYEALQTQHQRRFESLINLRQQLIDQQKQVESYDEELKNCLAKQQELEEKVSVLTTKKDRAQREYDKYLWEQKRHSIEKEIHEKQRHKQELERRLREQQQLSNNLTIAKTLLKEHEEPSLKLVDVLQQTKIIDGQLVSRGQHLSDLRKQRDGLLAASSLSRDKLRDLALNLPQYKQQILVLLLVCVITITSGIALAFVLGVYLVLLVSMLAMVPAYLSFRRYQDLERIDAHHRKLLSLEQQIQTEEAECEKLKREMSSVLSRAGVTSADEAQHILDTFRSLWIEKVQVDSLDALREKVKSLEDNLHRLEEQQPAAAIEIINQELSTLKRQLDELQKTRATDWEALEYSEQEFIRAENIFREAEKELKITEREAEGIKKRIQELEGRRESVQRGRDAILRQHGVSDFQNIEDELGSITNLLESQAKVRSFEALAEKIKSRREQQSEIDRRFQELTTLQIEKELEKQRRELQEIKGKLDELSIEKPEGVEELRFSEEAFKKVLNDREDAQADLREIEDAIKEHRGALAQVDRSLEELKDVGERLYAKEQEYLEHDYQRRVLERVRTELAETSRALRAQVVPYAAMLINNILPVITDSRYFQFEIDDDLKFKVYSQEAGSMKERDVFSGGTQDQFLIALRLAFTQSILDSRVRADRYCLLMDECISSSDEFRKKRIFSVLDYMKNTFPQIFIIAHEDITNEVDYALHLKRGKSGFTEIMSKNW